eukprot:6385316-Prymnesium_polylepis.1
MAAFQQMRATEGAGVEVPAEYRADLSFASLSAGVVPLAALALAAAAFFGGGANDACSSLLANAQACAQREALAKGDLVVETPIAKYSRDLVSFNKDWIDSNYAAK